MTELRCIMNQCSSSTTALCVTERKTYISVMGDSDRARVPWAGHVQDNFLHRRISLSLSFFPVQGNSCIMMDLDSRNTYISVVPKYRHSSTYTAENSSCLKRLELNSVRQRCKQPNMKHLKFEHMPPSWAILPYSAPSLLHAFFSKAIWITH